MACGHAEHADIHAAKNILQRGLVVWKDLSNSAAGHAASFCEENVRRQRVSKPDGAVSVKQNPTEEVAHV
jgi:transposase